MLLEVKGLKVDFKVRDSLVRAVDGVSFSLDDLESLAIVGESGSGKSQCVFSILSLLEKNGRASGSVRLQGKEILNISKKELNNIRFKEISIIFQDPMTSLNPYLKVDKQLVEVLKKHKNLSYKDAYQNALYMLDAVKIPESKKRMSNYPYELSGGMRQRIMIAMALLCKPKILIADEPTTALDVTIQAKIMDLLNEIKNEFNMSIILITHDLGVVANSSDRVLVMYAGKVVESGNIDDIFYDARHPYTTKLLESIPRLDDNVDRLNEIKGDPPNILNLPKGCSFYPRCPISIDRCKENEPPLVEISKNRNKACFVDLINGS